MAIFNRFSLFTKSGAHPGPSGDERARSSLIAAGRVTPPGPEKYGTFAARWLYSQRNVMYSLGIQSKVPETSQALNESPGFYVIEPQADTFYGIVEKEELYG